MDNQQAHIKALELILFYLQNQDVTGDLQEQGFTDDDREQIQAAYVEFVDSVKYSVNLWKLPTQK